MKHAVSRLICKSCGAAGAAVWGDVQSRRQRDLVEFSAGFASIERDKAQHHFRCQTCDCKVKVVDRPVSKAA